MEDVGWRTLQHRLNLEGEFRGPWTPGEGKEAFETSFEKWGGIMGTRAGTTGFYLFPIPDAAWKYSMGTEIVGEKPRSLSSGVRGRPDSRLRRRK